MKKKNYLILFSLLLAGCAMKRNGNAVAYGSFTDPRDGRSYCTVRIGKQTWMAENLNYNYPGAIIANNDIANAARYGRLYSFNSLKLVSPPGWHVPSDVEWREMESTCPDPVRTLRVVFGGEYRGRFFYVGEKACFFSSSHSGTPVVTRYISAADGQIKTNLQGIAWRLSVRCIKDDD